MRCSAFRGSGLVTGFSIGHCFLLEALLPLAPDGSTEFEARYRDLLAIEGESLRGLFFCGRRPVLSPWLAGEVVLVIGKRKLLAFCPEINGRGYLRRTLEIEIPGKDGYW